jgi:hypothetical protein
MGVGPHAELLALSGETFRVYAGRHGYDLDLRQVAPSTDRPIPWAKVLLLQEALSRFDLVLWIDADAAVVDPSVDIADLLGGRDLMGMVAHATPESDDPIPNCGVWLVRSHRMTRKFLDDVWRSTAYIEHKWWENAAVMDLLGYELAPAVRLVRPTPMYRRTHFLPTEWNSIAADGSPTARIVHFPGAPLAERIAGLEAAVARLHASEGDASV